MVSDVGFWILGFGEVQSGRSERGFKAGREGSFCPKPREFRGLGVVRFLTSQLGAWAIGPGRVVLPGSRGLISRLAAGSP